MTVTRPLRTEGHRQRDALLQQFHDVGLIPVVSTNGSDPEADIQVSFDRTTRPGGDVVRADLTERGAARLAAFTKPVPA